MKELRANMNMINSFVSEDEKKDQDKRYYELNKDRIQRYKKMYNDLNKDKI